MILLHKAKSSADKDLRDRVEQQLDWNPEINSAKIGVAAEDGVVTLTGFVETYSEKLAAEKDVKRVYGVKGLANEIEVKLPSKRTDTDIVQDALHALKSRVNVPDDKIKLTAKDGWLYLDGKVDWKYQKDAAESAVRRLSGVRGVTNRVDVRPRASSFEVRTKIEDALTRNAEIDARRILVETHDGTVELWGNVRTWLEKEEAEGATWNAPGVISVKNHIMVVP